MQKKNLLTVVLTTLALIVGLSLIIGIVLYGGVLLWREIEKNLAGAQWPIIGLSKPEQSTVVPVAPEPVTDTAEVAALPGPTSNEGVEKAPLTLYESEGEIPYGTSSIYIDVAPDEVVVVTGGPMSVAEVQLPGGENRGSVIVMLPATDKVTTYKVENLIPGSNWMGAYRATQPLTEGIIQELVEDRLKAMKSWPNCTTGEGCAVVDVLVIGPGGVIDQEVR